MSYTNLSERRALLEDYSRPVGYRFILFCRGELIHILCHIANSRARAGISIVLTAA